MRIIRFGIILPLMTSPIAGSDSDRLPKANEVLDRFVRVTGGAAYQKIRNRREHVEIRTSYQKGVVDNVHETATPNLVRGRIAGRNGGVTEYGFFKDRAWVISAEGSFWVTGEELKWEALYARFDLDYNWRSYLAKVRTVSQESLEGKDCFKLSVITHSNLELTLYFEVATGLRRGIEVKETRRHELVRITRFFFDYRKVDGVMIPHQMRESHRTSTAAWTTTVKTKSIEHNVHFPTGHFKPPATVTIVPKPGWLRFGFPRSYNPDLLEGLPALAELGVKHDPALDDALDHIERKRGTDGRWKLDDSLNGKMLADIERKGKPSKWITLRAMTVFRHFKRIVI